MFNKYAAQEQNYFFTFFEINLCGTNDDIGKLMTINDGKTLQFIQNSLMCFYFPFYSFGYGFYRLGAFFFF